MVAKICVAFSGTRWDIDVLPEELKRKPRSWFSSPLTFKLEITSFISVPFWALQSGSGLKVCMCVYVLEVKALFPMKLLLHAKLKPLWVWFFFSGRCCLMKSCNEARRNVGVFCLVWSSGGLFCSGSATCIWSEQKGGGNLYFSYWTEARIMEFLCLKYWPETTWIFEHCERQVWGENRQHLSVTSA